MSDTDYWGIYDTSQDNLQLADSKSEAEDRRSQIVSLGADPSAIEVRQPGELPVGETTEVWCDACWSDTEHEVQQDGATLVCLEHDGETQTQTQTPEADGGTEGESVDPEIVDHSPGSDTDTTDTESVATDAPAADAEQSLPEQPDVDTDPLTWMPGEFVDEIDGSPAINRKGFAVLKQRYGIGVTSDVIVGPEETDHTFVRVAAHAEDTDGVISEAHGSAHVDRGDDPHLLLELADTRAKKRALSDATGVGMLAVAELQHGGDGT